MIVASHNFKASFQLAVDHGHYSIELHTWHLRQSWPATFAAIHWPGALFTWVSVGDTVHSSKCN
jgi:hypothetical protein